MLLTYKAALVAVITLPALFGGSINFERSAPCVFLQAEPLGNEYTPVGPAFYSPIPSAGGAVIGQCGNFGINARSGTDFLAFNAEATMINGKAPAGPEVIRFPTPVSNISLFVGGTDTSPTYSMDVYDVNTILLGAVTASPPIGKWLPLTYNASNIGLLILSYTSNLAVVDDLSWDNPVTAIDNPVPEPGAVALTGLGLALLAAIYKSEIESNSAVRRSTAGTPSRRTSRYTEMRVVGTASRPASCTSQTPAVSGLTECPTGSYEYSTDPGPSRS